MYSVNSRLSSAQPKRLPWVRLMVILGVGLTGCSQLPTRMEQAAEQAAHTPFSQLDRSQFLEGDRPAIADVEALVAMGARVTGTPIAEQSSRYLEEAFQQAGYVTEVQTFTYSKFTDRGSTLTINGSTLSGRALNGSNPGRLTARLVVVPNVGRREDFAQVDVRGAIAIVQRGEIRFLEKARNAAAAGALGLIIVNTDDNNFQGTLGSGVSIPVLSLGGEDGRALLSNSAASPVTLNVNAVEEMVTGRNVIAYMEGVTQPDVLLGAHYDSVAGSPGANDNASGTAVLLNLARQMADTPSSRQVWFVAFDGEEDGLRGSRTFVREAQPQFLQQLRAMLNLDMVGVNAGLQASGTSELTRLATTVNPSISIFGEAGGSDHASFAAVDVPVLFLTRGMEPNYHSPNDRQVNAQLLSETAQITLDVLNRLLTPNA
ncbi:MULTISPECIES: M28 family peptidase [unclassified Leptolyngbya]|uniref:M28 family peptidase n=1 Tax=unclassified Leptolyngbya TaxID=2650499 RepID=UPI0018F02CEC|nr:MULTISPECIES: M28 family peptidase [unclassified Leptolyngbya]